MLKKLFKWIFASWVRCLLAGSLLLVLGTIPTKNVVAISGAFVILNGVLVVILSRIANRVKITEQQSNSSSKTLAGATQTLAGVTQSIDQMDRRLDVHFGATYIGGFTRELDEPAVDELLQYWCPRMNVELRQNQIRYLERKVITIEALSIGRLATSVDALIVRIMAAMRASVGRQTPRFLEIGTLFGLGSALLHEVPAFGYGRPHVTVIDPFDGYYGEGIPDVQTGLSVSRNAVEINSERLGIPKDRLKIISGFSAQPEVMDQIESGLDLLVIDGDHSYEGVSNDFELYLPKVRIGGLIVVDDYQVANWPDVTKFADEIRATNTSVEFVGGKNRTAIFEKLP